MNDGGKAESGRNRDGYSRALARIGVAQICESVGFQSFQGSALDVLSEVAIRYLKDLGKTAHLYANLAGRTECSVFDVVQGLEDLVSMQGFSGASDVNRSLAGSGMVKEIMQYVGAEEVPFAREVVRFPVAKDRKPTPSFTQTGEVPGGEHIPSWLPVFPDPKTYTQTAELQDRRIESPEEKVIELRQWKQEEQEQSLHSLQQRLVGNDSSGFTSLNVVEDGKAKQTAESNPFLAPPLLAGEKEVATIVPPEKVSNASNEHPMDNRISVLETFAPAIGETNAVNDSRDNDDDDRKVLPSKRAVVNFKLGVSKKSLGLPVDLALQRKSAAEESASLILRDNDKDDKKRRAEQILKESIDKSRELA